MNKFVFVKGLAGEGEDLEETGSAASQESVKVSAGVFSKEYYSVRFTIVVFR